MMPPFQPTDPFRRWLDSQPFVDRLLLTVAGLALGAGLLL